MEELKDVVLNIYTLSTDSPELGRTGSFFGRLLPSLGMGAYHTSLQLDGYIYTFAANAGIIKTSTRHQGVPTNASFKESIPLGSACVKNRGEVNAIIKELESFFAPTAYHLVHRNCNHFTETFATALILKDELVDHQKKNLETFPVWVNRLATTGSAVVSHDSDIVPCNVLKEARKAVGADEKIGWSLQQSKSKNSLKKGANESSKKKTLTEKQKAALAKIRKT